MVRPSDAPASIEFGHFSIFPHRRQLFAEGRPITLGGRAFDVLMALIEASGAVVGKDELLNQVWQGRIVEENRLAGEIVALRKAFGADRELIRTVAGRGYQFTGEIRARPSDVGEREVLDAAADVASSMIPVGAGSSRPEKPSVAVLPFANMTSDQERKDVTEPAGVALPVPVFHAALDSVGEAVADIPQPALVLPDKPSIAVLPCTNMSDVEQDFFADGITEDIITALSHYPSLFVVARNSCFTYKGRAIDVRQVACELGVRYVLESSLRRADNRIRITAQLVEADTGKHAWAEHYDRDLADIFVLQDEITEAVTTAIAPAIAEAEQKRAMRKPPGNLDAWAAYQRGLWHLGKATTEDNALAQMLFGRAIDLDPNFSGAYVGLAEAQGQTTDFRTDDLAGTLHSAEALARRAVALDGADAEARSLLAHTLWRRGDYEGALSEVRRALAISPNLAYGHATLGAALIFSGHPKEGLAALERSIRLDPRDPRSAIRLNQRALGLYFSREYAAAVEAARHAIRSYPDFPNSYRWLAAALGQRGGIEEANEALHKAIAVAPAAFQSSVHSRVPWMRPEDHAHMLEGLRKACGADRDLIETLYPGRGDQVTGEVLGAGEQEVLGMATTVALPDKPSIAVLPFQNMSGDPEQEYFADGMVEEIITALSRIRWLFVVARNSSFIYKGQTPDVKRVGHELGVRYVLEGSVRKAGGCVRITAQLIDATNGAHLWADHFDGLLEDVFDLQDKVASSVAGVIEPALQAAETARSADRPTNDLTAYDLYLRAYQIALSSSARYAEALRLLELAINRDPHYVPALAWAAFCCHRVLLDGGSEDPAAHRLKGTDYARRALEVAGDDPAILANAAYTLGYLGEDIGATLELVDRALALNPSFARGWFISGVLRLYAGQPEIAIEHAEASLRLSPRARVGWALLTIGAAHFYARRFDQAVPKLLLAIQEDASLPNPYRYLAACYAHMGRLDEARVIVARLQAVTSVVIPDLTYLRNAEHREFYRSGLRLAAGEAA
jgi:adenylate cyclase